MKSNKTIIAFALAALLVGLKTNVGAEEDGFYQGKTIKVIVGFTSGGFYDRWSRLLARYVPKYLPGHPEMVVQNMPGAGGMIAANNIYGVAKPDGLSVAMLSYGLYLDQLVGRKEVQYDVRKLNWIGSPEKSEVLMYMRADAPFKTIEDIRNASTPPKCGSTGTAGTDYIWPVCSKTHSARRSKPFWATRAGARSISRWKRAKFNAADLPPRHFLAVSRSFRGAREISSMCCFTAASNAIRVFRTRRRFTKSSTRRKPRKKPGELPM